MRMSALKWCKVTSLNNVLRVTCRAEFRTGILQLSSDSLQSLNLLPVNMMPLNYNADNNTNF